MFILGIVATLMSVVGYLIVSNIKASNSLKIKGNLISKWSYSECRYYCKMKGLLVNTWKSKHE